MKTYTVVYKRVGSDRLLRFQVKAASRDEAVWLFEGDVAPRVCIDDRLGVFEGRV